MLALFALMRSLLLAQALKLDPQSPMAYIALGNTLASQEFTLDKLKPAIRDKALGALKTALDLSEASPGQAASIDRLADTHYVMGSLLSGHRANEAMTHFREAAGLAPRVERYAEAVSSMLKGAEEYRKDQQRAASKEENARLKQLEEEEDAAWEEDGLSF